MLKLLKKKFYSSETVVRQFGKYSNFNKKVMDSIQKRFSLLASDVIDLDVRRLLDTSDVCIENFRGKKLVQVSTWNTTCGIAAYAKAVKEGLAELAILSQNDIVSIDVAKIHKGYYDENENYYKDIADKCAGYDIIIVQYEFGFFASDKYYFPKDIELFCNFIKNLNTMYPRAEILIYIHTSLNILGFKDASEYLRISENFVEIAKIEKVHFIVNTLDLLTDWYGCGIKANLGVDPVKKFYKDSLYVNLELKQKISQKLDLKEGDTVLMMLGFINPMKRYDELVEILSLLPENFKFLAAGGIFPDSPQKHLKKLKKRMKQLRLEDRVYITGLFNDEDLGTYFDIADIMCAPYAKVRSGSGSIPMLLLPEKPIIAYETPMITLVNSQTQYRPIIDVEYDNRELFKKKILKIAEKGAEYSYAVEQIKKYSVEIDNKKLACLVIKTLCK